MTGYNTGQRGRSSSRSSSTSSKKSAESPYKSRSPSQGDYLDNVDSIQRAQSVSFSLEEKENEKPHSRKPVEIETPHGPVRRPETFEALGCMSAQSWRQGNEPEPKWPTDWRAYACLFGGFLLMFNSWGLVNAYGTYSSFYMQHLLPGRDLLLLNLVGSTESGIVLALSAIVGRFLDAGYIRTLIIIGTVLVTTGQFALSGVNGDGGQNDGNYGLIWLTQGLLTGLGMACFFVSSSQVVATWFKAKKSFAIGIVASGASIAGFLYPYMAKSLIQQDGFNNAQRYVATVVCLTSALAIFIARPNPDVVFRKPDHWFNISLFWDTKAFHNRAYAFLVASIAFLFFGFYAVFFNLEEWAISEGFGYRKAMGDSPTNDDTSSNSSIETFWLLSIMNGSSTIGRLGSAYLCDHFGALNVHAVVTTVASLLVLILWTLSSTLPSAIAFVVIFGAFSGAVIGLPPASVAYVLGPSPEAQAKLGQWTGMMYSCAAVFALTGPVIAGHLITEYNTYVTVQCWAGGTMFMSAICMCCAVYYRRRDSKSRRMSTATTVCAALTQEKQEV